MTDRAPIAGFANPPFEGVREAFARNFSEDLELGAGFALIVDGKLEVNLMGGYADRAEETPWSEDTIACIYSCGKAALALLVAREVSNGTLDYDAPIARYWPEFGAAGKEDITLAEVMSHQAGLCGFSEEMPPQDWIDWEAICRRIEKQAPLWPPKTANGYSPQLVGFIIGEVLRRAAGRSVHDLLSEFHREKGLQLFCGMGVKEAARTAYMRKPPAAPDLGALNKYKEIAFLKPWSAPGRIDREAWMAAEIPASNMHAAAVSLASIVYPFANRGCWLDGEPLLGASAVEKALAERIRGDDLVLPFHLSWSAGLMRNSNNHFGPNSAAFGHGGFGGSCVMLDPENRLSAAYVMNRMSPYLVGDPRAVCLLDAVYDAL